MLLLIFTDLDGTLLNHQTYDYQPTLPALRLINQLKVPLIFVTSKTRAEVEALDRKLAKDGIRRNAPFTFENGVGVALPTHLFSWSLISAVCQQIFKDCFITKRERGWIVSFGTKSYAKLCEILDKQVAPLIRGKVIGLHQMTAEQFSVDSGLTIEQAKLAKQREFDEPFKIEPDQELPEAALAIIKKHRLSYTKGGRYHHLLNHADKTGAVKIIAALYRKKSGQIKTVGIGDSLNDLAFLTICDRGFLLTNPHQTIPFDKIPQLIAKTQASGPIGWNKIVLRLLQTKQPS